MDILNEKNFESLKLKIKELLEKKDLQEKRIEKRNGEEVLQIFKNLWIPKEEMYFKKFKIQEKCDMIFEN